MIRAPCLLSILFVSFYSTLVVIIIIIIILCYLFYLVQSVSKGLLGLAPLLNSLIIIVPDDSLNSMEELCECLLHLACMCQSLGTVVHGCLILMHEEEETNLLGSVSLEGLLDGDEILEGLGHLAARNVKVTRVDEVIDPLVVVEVGLGLGQLVVVVGELQVLSSCVDICRILISFAK